MVTLTRINSSENKEFIELIDLYVSAFPEEERRPVEMLRKMVDNGNRMRFNSIKCDGVLSGLFIYWEFEDFYFLEHLAIYDSMRNMKIGSQLLSYIGEHLKKEHVLEVERPETEIAARRIAYYERNGYKVADRNYMQPSYNCMDKSYPLWLMSSSGSVNPEWVNDIKTYVYYNNV